MRRVHTTFHRPVMAVDVVNWVLLLSALVIIVLSLLWALFWARPLPGTT